VRDAVSYAVRYNLTSLYSDNEDCCDEGTPQDNTGGYACPGMAHRIPSALMQQAMVQYSTVMVDALGWVRPWVLLSFRRPSLQFVWKDTNEIYNYDEGRLNGSTARGQAGRQAVRARRRLDVERRHRRAG
jgi:hypothetical protein